MVKTVLHEILAFWTPLLAIIGGGFGFMWRVVNGKQSKSGCKSIHDTLNQQSTDLRMILNQQLIETREALNAQMINTREALNQQLINTREALNQQISDTRQQIADTRIDVRLLIQELIEKKTRKKR